MFSQKIKYFFYGALVSASLISVSSYALGADDGVFGIYFQNMISSATTCGTDEVIVGFVYTDDSNYGKPRCTTFQTIVKSIILPHLPIEGQAVVGFNPDGSPKYGDVNWHKDWSENLSYTGAGNVGIGTDSPGSDVGMTKGLTINGDNATQFTIQKNGVSGFALNTNQSTVGDWVMYDKVGGTWNGSLASKGGNIGVGTSNPAYKLDVNGDVINNGWYRSRGDTGWYNESYGGGWFMQDTTWIRAYNNKNIYTGGDILASKVSATNLCIGSDCKTSWGTASSSYGLNNHPAIGGYSATSGSHPMIVMARGGDANSCNGGTNNSYDLNAYVGGSHVVSSSNNNDRRYKNTSITFVVPPNTTYSISSYPYECGGGGGYFYIHAYEL